MLQLYYYDKKYDYFKYMQIESDRFGKILNSNLSNYDKLNAIFILYKYSPFYENKKFSIDKVIIHLQKYNIKLLPNIYESYNYLIDWIDNSSYIILHLIYNLNYKIGISLIKHLNNLELFYLTVQLLKKNTSHIFNKRKYKKYIKCLFFTKQIYYLFQELLYTIDDCCYLKKITILNKHVIFFYY